MEDIQLIISDFDGTLIDTFQANFLAYKKAFNLSGIDLSYKQYQNCYGFRFDDFMFYLGVIDKELKEKIKLIKENIYPDYFYNLRLNTTLINFLSVYKDSGKKIALASTASKINITNILDYFNLNSLFDMILVGEDVVRAKPDPEIFIKIMSTFNISCNNTLIFEDSLVGFQAANASGAKYIKINNYFFK